MWLNIEIRMYSYYRNITWIVMYMMAQFCRWLQVFQRNLVPLPSALKQEGAGAPEMLLTTYEVTWC